MNKGAIDRVITLMGYSAYYNFTWVYLGFSGGSKMYDSYADYFPDVIGNLYHISKN